MRAILACAILVSVTACSQRVDTFRETLKSGGAELADQVLDDAEFIICRGATVGSIMRRYGSDVELARAWRTICVFSPEAVEQLITPPTI